MTRSLSVWWDGAVVGTLRVDEHGAMTFAYASEWLADGSRMALSISLPKRPEPFKQRECRPFFAGLLPEEEPRKAVAQALHISRANDFRLLEALGGDVAGALSLWSEGETPPTEMPIAESRALDDQALAEILETLPQRPLLAGHEGLRLSLAGAQPKVPVVLTAGQVALPAAGQPTTHIVKPPIARFESLTENETLVMRLAAAIRLRVAAVEPRVAAGRRYLLVTRYDRRVDESGRTRRLHQEDFDGSVTLAPLYDLVCTVAYPGLSPRFAMRIGKSKALEELNPAAWSTFAAEIGIAAPFVRRRATELADEIYATVEQVAEGLEATGLDRGALTQYASAIRSRAIRVARV